MLYFNSIKVRLEHASLASLCASQCHFNSIKVRLEQIPFLIITVNSEFQFHKGTIRTH